MRQPPPRPGSTSASPPGADGTALESRRLTAGATAMPPRPAANVPSSAARPNGMPGRGVGVGISIRLTVPLDPRLLQPCRLEFTPGSCTAGETDVAAGCCDHDGSQPASVTQRLHGDVRL